MAEDRKQSGELKDDAGKMGSVGIWGSQLLSWRDAQLSARWEPTSSWLAIHRE